MLSEFGGTAGGSVSATGGALDSGAEVGFGNDTFQGPYSGNVFSGVDSTNVFLSDNFSLNTLVTITHTAGGQTTNVGHKLSVAVPEPGAAAVLLGLSGLICIPRRRKASLISTQEANQ